LSYEQTEEKNQQSFSDRFYYRVPVSLVYCAHICFAVQPHYRFYEPFGEWFYWTVINTLVGCTLIFNRAGTAFSIIGLINAGRKNMGGKGFAIIGIILAELQAVLYVFGLLVYLIQKLCAGAGP